MMWYVNDLLCYDEESRDRMISFYTDCGKSVNVRPVPQDKQGRYILPINDPMEQ